MWLRFMLWSMMMMMHAEGTDKMKKWEEDYHYVINEAKHRWMDRNKLNVKVFGARQ